MLIVILLGLFSLLALYLRHVYSYWTRRGVPQLTPVPFLGNFFSIVFSKNTPNYFYHKIYQNNCTSHDAIGIYQLMTPKLMLINPHLSKQVLISDFSSFNDNDFPVSEKLDPYFYHDPFCLQGEAWKSGRTLMVSLLTSNKVKEMFPYMTQLIPNLDSYIDGKQNKEIEAKELSDLFMMDNVSSTMFGLEGNCFTDPESDFRKIGDLLVREFQFQGWFKKFIMNYSLTLRDLFGFSIIPSAVNDYLENMMKKIIEYRKNNNIKRSDVIQTLMSKKGDSIFDMVVMAMAVFIDGFETSSSTASFALYELAMNPDIQQNLREEIKTAMTDSKDLDYDSLINLPYLDKIIKETMRKYPIAYYLRKLCTKRCSLNIDGKQVDIEPGTAVIVPVYSPQNDPRYFPDPDVFDPERFSDNRLGNVPCTYMPFGEGPRICPGMRFAGAQVKLFLSNIVHKYTILPTKNTPSKLKLSKETLLLASDKPINLFFEKTA